MIIHTSEKMTDQEIQLYKHGQRLGVINGLICGLIIGIGIGLVISIFAK